MRTLLVALLLAGLGVPAHHTPVLHHCNGAACAPLRRIP